MPMNADDDIVRTETRNAMRRGYGLLEGLLSIAILAALIVSTTRYNSQAQQTQQARILATKLSILSQAADAYLKRDSTLGATSVHQIMAPGGVPTPGAMMLIPMLTANHNDMNGLDFGVQSLQDAGVLGQNFQDVNGYEQKTALLITNPTLPAGSQNTGYEAFLVTYGGEQTPDAVMTYAEGMSEGRVGAILNNDTQSTDGSVYARGARGGWTAPLATLQQGGLNVGPGHMVSYVSLEKGGFTQSPSAAEYLSRNNTGDPNDNTMQVDINMAGSGLDNTDHVSGNAGVLTLSGGSGTGPAAGPGTGGTVLIAGDASVAGAVTAGGTVSSNTQVAAPVFYSGNNANYDTSYFLNLDAGNNDPNGGYNNSNAVTGPDCTASPTGCGTSIKRLHADAFDLNTIAYSSAQGGDARQFPAGLTIADLMPNQVNKSSFLATDGAVIPKPNCNGATGAAGGDQRWDLARIYAYPTGIFNASAPSTTVDATVSYHELSQVVTDVELNGTSPNYTINTTTDNGGGNGFKSFDGLTMDTTTTAANMYEKMSADTTTGSATWTLNLQTWATDQNGTAFQIQDNITLPDGLVHHNEALVQTACFYQ